MSSDMLDTVTLAQLAMVTHFAITVHERSTVRTNPEPTGRTTTP